MTGTRIQGKRGRTRVTPFGKWSETSRVHLDLHRFSASLYVVGDGTKNPDLEGEEGPEVIVAFSRDGELMYMSLTSLTHAGLGAFKEFMDIAVANAQDIVLQRDQTAQEALENGDDSYVRVYRTVPNIVIREGQKWPDYPRIRRGFEWIAQLVPEFTTKVMDLRGDVKSVPQRGSENSGTKDS